MAKKLCFNYLEVSMTNVYMLISYKTIDKFCIKYQVYIILTNIVEKICQIKIHYVGDKDTFSLNPVRIWSNDGRFEIFIQGQ